MCGLLAVGGAFNQEKVDFYRTMLYLSGLRGKDGTGVCSFRMKTRKSNNPRMTYTLSKSASSVSEFLDDNGVCVRTNDFLQIAHCRAATRGAVNDENCQPFQYEKIVGMHNGTLFGFYNTGDGMSDSYHLLKLLNNEGVEAAVDKIGTGSAALIWVDKQDRTLNIYRNKERTLSMTVLDKGSFLAIASESDMLKYAADRSMSEEATVYDFEPEKIYTFALPFGAKIEMPDCVDAPKAKPTTYSYGGGGTMTRRSYYDGQAYGEFEDDQIPFTGPTNTGAASENSKGSPEGEVIRLPYSGSGTNSNEKNGSHPSGNAELSDGGSTINIGGEWVSMDKLKAALSGGCNSCKKVIGIEELDTQICEKMMVYRVRTTENYEFVCDDCMSAPPTELNQ